MAQQIVVVQRIRYLFHFETFALVRDPNGERTVAHRDADMYLLIPVVAVAVYHGVYHAFPDGHSNPVLLVLVEPRFFSGLEDLRFRLIDAFERGWVVLIKKFFCAGIHVFWGNQEG